MGTVSSIRDLNTNSTSTENIVYDIAVQRVGVHQVRHSIICASTHLLKLQMPGHGIQLNIKITGNYEDDVTDMQNVFAHIVQSVVSLLFPFDFTFI